MADQSVKDTPETQSNQQQQQNDQPKQKRLN